MRGFGYELFAITAVVSRGPDSVHIATVVWPKTPFASWWRQARGGFSDELAIASTSFAPATPAAGCIINTWNATGAGINLPAPRYGQTAVWTGIEMIVWGGYGTGYLSSGGIYVPALDSWSATDESANVPTPRGEHAALWTGTEMIVWGGFDGTSFLNSGARYDLLTNSWTPTGQGANVPSARKGETLVWSGSRMIVWGGFGVTGPTKTGAIYNPLADTWLPVSKTGAPAPRTKHTALWIGTEMVVWGGTDSTGVFNFSSGGRYDPVTDAWTHVGNSTDPGNFNNQSGGAIYSADLYTTLFSLTSSPRSMRCQAEIARAPMSSRVSPT